jgi:glycosyltransferase involved in cell wall biosynthesis
VRSLRDRLLQVELLREADLVVSLTPQSDMALSTTRLRWVAYLRGLPWPSAGEASALRRIVWRSLERLALRRALETWSTTTILVEEAQIEKYRLVPPGIMRPTDWSRPGDSAKNFVWAARYSEDKNPSLFMEAMARTNARGVMFGTGPLEADLRASAPLNVEVGGWRNKAELWRDARAYVGTSYREAFGRSAVEAAMLGLPVVLSDRFGCAPMLYTDPVLAHRFVLPTSVPSLWVTAIEDLNRDDGLHEKVAAHVLANAQALTIDSAIRNVQEAATSVSQLLPYS